MDETIYVFTNKDKSVEIDHYGICRDHTRYNARSKKGFIIWWRIIGEVLADEAFDE